MDRWQKQLLLSSLSKKVKDMKKFAITGTIGSGKSTVSILFKRFQIPVFDADGYSKLCLMDNHPAAIKIKEVFKESVLNENGYLDRKKIASVVFNNEEARQQLNAIVHPFVKEGLLNFFERYKDHDLVGAEIPLLYECGWEDLFDKVIVVTCHKETAIQRLMEYREFTYEEAVNRLNVQIDSDKQIEQADTVIYNDGSLKELNTEVRNWIKENR